jgi:hypothetical protein
MLAMAEILKTLPFGSLTGREKLKWHKNKVGARDWSGRLATI